MEELTELACEIAPEYPGIEDAFSGIQAAAILGAHKDVLRELEEAHAVIEALRIKAGLNQNQLTEIWHQAAKSLGRE